MKKKDMCYKSIDALEEVKRVLDAANDAISDKSKTILNTPIPEIAGGLGGAGLGGVAAGGLIYALGKTGLSAVGISTGLKTLGFGISMMTGVGVAAAIVVVPAVGGYALFARAKNNNLQQEKERLYKEALTKHNRIIEELENEVYATRERNEYLKRINIQLEQVIINLTHDLEVA